MTDRNAHDPASLATHNVIPALPTPDGGAGSHELAIDSDDPLVLRQNLVRARERLAFYESFDRIIGENIRRSGELMLETIALREQAHDQEAERARQAAELSARQEAELTLHHSLFRDLLDEAERVQASVDGLHRRLSEALTSLSVETFGNDPDEATLIGSSSNPVANEPAIERQSAPPPEPGLDATPARLVLESRKAHPAMTPASAANASPGIDVLLHGVPRAATALAFQRYLTGKAGVATVETREFAEGILRLSVTTTDSSSLLDDAFAGWSEGGHIVIRSRNASVVELDLHP